MKVAIINKSDSLGGAAVVSRRLMQALCKEGIEAEMLVMEAMNPENDNITQYGRNLEGKIHFLSERLDIFLNNNFSRPNLFKVSTAKYGFDLSKHPIVKNADAILINWINQGAMSLDGIESLCKSKKPIFWTMHDMWECTGICHHALECDRYKNECGNCPFLSSYNPHDLSYKTFLRKKALYKYPNLHFVAVSNWLKEKCSESALLKDKDVHVIPNAFPIEKFSFKRRKNLEGIPEDKKVIIMGAARLDDPIKGFDMMVESMNEIANNRPDLAQKLHLLLYGTIRDASMLDKINISFNYLGKINSSDRVAVLYESSDIVVSTSLYETLSGTLIEGAAAGCIPVTFGNGGQKDIVTHLKTGYIADYKSPISIANGIDWAINNPIPRIELHNNIKSKFSSNIVAAHYIDIIEKFLKK